MILENLNYSKFFVLINLYFFMTLFVTLLFLKMTSVDNPFWASVIRAFSYLKDKSCKNPDSIFSEPIWFNEPIKLEYIKLWDKKGLKCVGDLFNS